MKIYLKFFLAFVTLAISAGILGKWYSYFILGNSHSNTAINFYPACSFSVFSHLVFRVAAARTPICKRL
jgi:hypothetical protein